MAENSRGNAAGKSKAQHIEGKPIISESRTSVSVLCQIDTRLAFSFNFFVSVRYESTCWKQGVNTSLFRFFSRQLRHRR